MHLLCGVKQKAPGYRFQSREYDHFQVIQVVSGRLDLVVEGRSVPIPSGWACVLRKGSAFELQCEARRASGVFVSVFDADQPEHTGPSMVVRADEEMSHVAGMIEREVGRPGENAREFILHLGSLLGLLAVRQVKGVPEEEARESPAGWVAQAQRIIRNNAHSDRPVEQVLSGLELGYRQLSRHFREVAGMTPKQYQMQCRMDHAKRLLTTTSLSITTIGTELGFASSQHFCSQFARYEGCSPGCFRKTFRKGDLPGVEFPPEPLVANCDALELLGKEWGPLHRTVT